MYTVAPLFFHHTLLPYGTSAWVLAYYDCYYCYWLLSAKHHAKGNRPETRALSKPIRPTEAEGSSQERRCWMTPQPKLEIA